VTADWLTSVQVVRGLADPPAGTDAGPYNVLPVATKVPHAVSPNHSPAESPVWLTAQFRSVVFVMDVSGPDELIVAEPVDADAAPVPAATPAVATAVMTAAAAATLLQL
jgi:hypothetical protein